MLLTETTVDAETAEPVDGAKMLVDGVGDLSVNDAVMVVKAADRLVGGHEGLDGLIELSLKDVDLLNCGGSVCHLALEPMYGFHKSLMLFLSLGCSV